MAGAMPIQATGQLPSGSGGGLHPILNAILNVATLGEHDNPGSLSAYGRSVAESFNPTSPAGAFNLASILVPGGRMGGATFNQARFLQAINEGTFGRQIPSSPIMFDRSDPAVHALMQHLGAPPMSYHPGDLASARPAWVAIDPRTFSGIRGGAGGRRMSNAFSGDLPIGDLAAHQNLVRTLVAKNAIQRRN